MCYINNGDTMKKEIKEMILNIVTFIFFIILTITLTLNSIINITKKYKDIEEIKNIVNKIDLTEILKNKSNKELEEIENSLIVGGIPTSTIESFLNTKEVKNYSVDIINNSITNDEKLYSSEKIYEFLEQNITPISKKLQEENVKGSEILTEENNKKILEKLKDKTPNIEKAIDKIIDEKLEKYNNKINKTVDKIEIIYSKKITIILIFLEILSVIMIIISSKSFYKSLKWIGLSFILNSIILLTLNLIIKYIIINITEEIIKKYISIIFNDLLLNLKKEIIIYLILGLIFIVLNIIIKIIKIKKLVNKEKI